MNSPRCGGLCGASSVHFGELCSAAASLQPGQSCEVGEVVRVGGDDALLVMGKRTRVLPGNQLRSACANGCEHLCRGRSSAGASNPGLLGAPVLPRAWGTCSSHAGRQGCVPSLPARERGREMGPFFPFPPPQIARCPPYRWGLCRPGVGQCCSGTGPCCPVCGEELQLWLTAPMGGMSNALAFIWVSPSSVAICHTRLDN